MLRGCEEGKGIVQWIGHETGGIFVQFQDGHVEMDKTISDYQLAADNVLEECEGEEPPEVFAPEEVQSIPDPAEQCAPPSVNLEEEVVESNFPSPDLNQPIQQAPRPQVDMPGYTLRRSAPMKIKRGSTISRVMKGGHI